MRNTDAHQMRGEFVLPFVGLDAELVVSGRIYPSTSCDFICVVLGIPKAHTFDIDALARNPGSEGARRQSSPGNATSSADEWLKWWLGNLNDVAGERLFLLLPSQNGYLIRSDIFHLRLSRWSKTKALFSPWTPGQLVPVSAPPEGWESIGELLDYAVCGVLVDRSTGDLDVLSELEDRMSLPWIMEQPWRRRRVALVGGGFSYEFRQHLLSSAAGLGIDLIVLDKPGHWMQHHVQETGLVTEFQEVDLTVDNDLADRIVAAVKRCSLPVDGLTTFTDCFLCPTAKAATVLKLPAMSVNALEKSVDKALMRNLIPIPVAPNSLANRNGRDDGELDHPLIVKPARGGGSFGVHLARTREELQAALGSVQGFGKEPVIERYIGGPEVDVDVVLQDGRVLFVEVSDNLPTTAEGFPSPLGRPSWAETSIISPSGLPSDELKQLGRVISSHLLDLGYSTGLIHCEARVQRSKRAYRPDGSGYPSLRDVDGAGVGDPQICLIEINPRSPGAKAAVQSAYATGVDFQGLQLLAACGDTERLSALAHPFSKPKQWWGSGYIAAETGGKFSPVTLFEELQSTAPALMKYVVDWTVFFKPGDTVRDPADTGEFLSVAWFLACSDVSRAHLESILVRVRESLEFTIA